MASEVQAPLSWCIHALHGHSTLSLSTWPVRGCSCSEWDLSAQVQVLGICTLFIPEDGKNTVCQCLLNNPQFGEHGAKVMGVLKGLYLVGATKDELELGRCLRVSV
eukprot:11641068-Alexandrium_andersonii.AAC.1